MTRSPPSIALHVASTSGKRPPPDDTTPSRRSASSPGRWPATAAVSPPVWRCSGTAVSGL
ncbi:hypothetical protein [Nonomuraea salmonea]|uniref:hypothetical protein n=1 Tax=Nonomuraea salmonea TaxID=46181 RepID=UPI0031ECBA4B